MTERSNALAKATIALTRVLVPIDHDPAPETALDALDAFNAAHGAALDPIHVGSGGPVIPHMAVRELTGSVVETILAEAEGAQLIAMPTRGRHGLLDALRGSTTERVSGTGCGSTMAWLTRRTIDRLRPMINCASIAHRRPRRETVAGARAGA